MTDTNTIAQLAAMTDQEFERWLRQRRIKGLEAFAWAAKRRAALRVAK